MLKTIFTYLTRLLALSIIVFLCYAWWVSNQARHYQSELGPGIQEKFGFSTGTPIIRAGKESIEVFTVYPKSGGLLEAAGFEEGDIVVSVSLTEFLKLLSEPANKLEFEVVYGGDGLPIEERKKRIVEVSVLH